VREREREREREMWSSQERGWKHAKVFSVLQSLWTERYFSHAIYARGEKWSKTAFGVWRKKERGKWWENPKKKEDKRKYAIMIAL
jgi:hypothetical protein